MASPSSEKRSDAPQKIMESELTSLFEDLADLFGNPRSLGAIYGLLFSSQIPLSMEEIVMKLRVSKGTASQGLRRLEELGAVVRHKDSSIRTATYSAKLELKPLITGFLNQRLLPELARSRQRLERLQGVISQLPPETQPGAKLRVHRVAKWHRRTNTLMPWVTKILQAK